MSDKLDAIRSQSEAAQECMLRVSDALAQAHARLREANKSLIALADAVTLPATFASDVPVGDWQALLTRLRKCDGANSDCVVLGWKQCQALVQVLDSEVQK